MATNQGKLLTQGMLVFKSLPWLGFETHGSKFSSIEKSFYRNIVRQNVSLTRVTWGLEISTVCVCIVADEEEGGEEEEEASVKVTPFTPKVVIGEKSKNSDGPKVEQVLKTDKAEDDKKPENDLKFESKNDDDTLKMKKEFLPENAAKTSPSKRYY